VKLFSSVASAVAAGALASSAGPALAFTAPQQPFASLDGRVHILRPAAAEISTSAGAVGTLTTDGWRLIWDGGPVTPGRMEVRLALRTEPTAPATRSVAYLQVGMSRSREAVRTCLTYGLDGGSADRLPDHIINGRHYTVWTNGDAGMNQNVVATDLRTVADGACYAVERMTYSDAASDPSPHVSLSAKAADAMLDAALASLQVGILKPGEALRPAAVRTPVGAVAR
jgi:hypothetical protein